VTAASVSKLDSASAVSVLACFISTHREVTMRVKFFAVALVFAFVSSGFANKSSLALLARKAASTNSAESAEAIAALRAEGPSGLEAFLSEHAARLKSRQMELAGLNPQAASPEWLSISAALDRICQQRDCYASRLYWHTDLDKAKAAARATGKPILSLRLLGRLDEELSCANSRFFRITLYANEEISKLLGERFILHWQSVRPVPKVTIDFGDGRKLERTLTGNSIHYILDSDGRPVDALPGLYAAGVFISELKRAEEVAVRCALAKTDSERADFLRQYHSARLRELDAAWAEDIAKAKITSPPSRKVASANQGAGSPPRAEAAARGAITKMVVAERPVLRGISTEPKSLDPKAEDAAWASIGALHADAARLDSSSRAVVRSKSLSRYRSADSLDRAVANLERVIAEDTARNEYVIRSRIHEWFVGGVVTGDLAGLNDKVYAELFFTPSSDKWLGLFPEESFTGIEDDGVRK